MFDKTIKVLKRIRDDEGLQSFDLTTCSCQQYKRAGINRQLLYCKPLIYLCSIMSSLVAYMTKHTPSLHLNFWASGRKWELFFSFLNRKGIVMMWGEKKRVQTAGDWEIKYLKPTQGEWRRWRSPSPPIYIVLCHFPELLWDLPTCILLLINHVFFFFWLSGCQCLGSRLCWFKPLWSGWELETEQPLDVASRNFRPTGCILF